MEQPVERLHEMGRELAAEQDAALAQTDHIWRARAAVVQGRTQRSPTARRLMPWAMGGLAVAATALLALMLLPQGPEALSFTTGYELSPAEVGDWIAAADGEQIPLHFSDGTELTLEPHTRARVTEIDHRGAQIMIEQGTARVSVVPDRQGRWQLELGPFEVLVHGTRFDVSWEPDDGQLGLSLHEGVVEVRGPILGEARVLEPGQTIRISLPEQRVEIRGARPEIARTEPTEPAPPPIDEQEPQEIEPREIEPQQGPVTDEPGDERASRQRRRRARQAGDPAPAPTWQELARGGQYRDALSTAEERGFDRILARSPVEEVLMLGDAARLARSYRRASEAYQTVRRRAPGGPQAAVAAFSLGRMAFERRRAYSDAARWFGIYLREQPRGPLAREAAGRIVEAQQQAGNLDAARSAAQRYLERYPRGPHAQLARGLLEQ